MRSHQWPWKVLKYHHLLPCHFKTISQVYLYWLKELSFPRDLKWHVVILIALPNKTLPTQIPLWLKWPQYSDHGVSPIHNWVVCHFQDHLHSITLPIWRTLNPGRVMCHSESSSNSYWPKKLHASEDINNDCGASPPGSPLTKLPFWDHLPNITPPPQRVVSEDLNNDHAVSSPYHHLAACHNRTIS